MAQLIRVVEVTGSHSTSIETQEIFINEDRIVTVRPCYEGDLGETRILLQNGKTVFVEDSMEDIFQEVNFGEGKRGLQNRMG